MLLAQEPKMTISRILGALKFILKWFAFTVGGLGGLYLIAAAIGSSWSVNSDWRETNSGITIYVSDNGIHTSLILPMATAQKDWRVRLPARDLRAQDTRFDWVMFGWGDRDFYLETPTWAELRPTTALSAFIGSGETVIHVDHIRTPKDIKAIYPIRLTSEEYGKLVHSIDAQFAPGANPAIPGYGQYDAFYPAQGRYSLAHTCNIWLGNRLTDAGVKIGAWTPFAEGVVSWFIKP
jgi:uncharacterized protein (TIGR02117 family)